MSNKPDAQKELDKLGILQRVWVTTFGGHTTLPDKRIIFWCEEHDGPCFGIRHGYGHAGEPGAYIRHQF